MNILLIDIIYADGSDSERNSRKVQQNSLMETGIGVKEETAEVKTEIKGESRCMM